MSDNFGDRLRVVRARAKYLVRESVSELKEQGLL